MGVPISFLDKYCPEQFDIVGMAKRGAGDPALKSHVYTKDEYPNYSDLNATPTLWVNGVLKNTYPRILICRCDVVFVVVWAQTIPAPKVRTFGQNVAWVQTVRKVA